MNKTTPIILISVFTTICYGQATQTKYFNNERLGKEVSQDKAKFSQAIIQNADGTVTTEVKDLKKNEIVRSETFKGNEPYGIWKFRYGQGYSSVDYNFSLSYYDKKCYNDLPIITSDYFQDNDSLGYKAPKVSTGDSTIYQFIAKNIIYPSRAKEEGIEGIVYLQFTLTKEGTLDNIVVTRGTNILLDKEAVRVLRRLKFSSPPKVNEQAYIFNCLALPIKFRLM